MSGQTDLILQADVLALGKVELQTFGEMEARRLMEEGWHDATKLMIDSRKYLEVLTAFNKALKATAVDELTAAGPVGIGNAKITLGNTGNRLSYSDDPIYVQLKEALDNRVELLKTAHKMNTTIYDEDGIEIPKVGIKTHGELVPKITL